MESKNVSSSINKQSSSTFAIKTKLLLDHVFGKEKPTKKVYTMGSKGKKIEIGLRGVRPVKINGKVYGSIAIAARQLHLDRYTIVKRCNSTKEFDKNFDFI